MSHPKKIEILTWLYFLTGCTSYQPQALTEQGVQQQLQTPTTEQLRIQAAQIKHPLLKPINFDLKDGLSPDEAALLAVLNNSEARAVRAASGIARAQLLQAGLLPNPTFSYNFDVPSGGLSEGKVMAFGLGLNWEVTALLTQDNKITAAQAGQQAVDLQIAWKEWQIAEAAKLASYQLLVYGKQQTLLQEILQRLESNRDQLQQAVNKGLATEIDKVAASTAKNAVQSRLQTIQQQTNLQQQRLNRAIGLKPNAVVSLQADIALADTVTPPNYETLTNHLAQRRLDLLALQQSYARQEEQLHIDVLQQFPKISIGMTQSKTDSSSYTVGAGVSLTLPIFDQNQGAIALATATRQQLFDEYSNRVFQTKADIAELLETIQSLNTQIQTVYTSLSDLTNLLQIYQRAHENGQVDVLSYYQAWNNVANKQLDLLTLQLHLIEARIGLEIATGIYDIGKS